MSNHFVPHKPPIPILNKSNMNPTERKTVKRNLNIDTLFRKNYYKTDSTHFLYTLPEPINNVVSMKITSVEIPYVWYTFSAANQSNEFTIHIYNYVDPILMSQNATLTPQTFSQVFQIPEGNYGSAELITAMNNYFSNLAGVFSYFYFDVEDTSSKCIIRLKTFLESSSAYDELVKNSGPDFYFEVDFRIQSDPTRPIYKNAGWMLGFKHPLYKVVYDISGIHNYIYLNNGKQNYRYYLMGESSYGNSMFNYFFIDVDDFHKNYSTNMHLSSTVDSYIGNTIMGRVQVISGFNTILTNTSNDFVFKTREYFGPIKLEKLAIRIINRFGDVMNINGNDYSMLLEIEQLYSQ